MEFLGLTLFAEGKLGKPEGKLRFTEIVLKPTLTMAQNQDRERANQLLEKAEQECLITRSLKCPVVVEPLVQHSEEIMAR
jgi:organic hydroperoxide reductase OsmC/OhrA